ncbi:aminoglycoside phosphotransferase family protein [Streptomyces sp. NPDC060035]|uniref:aminoglycoside phosphotransferase family protein n=1 Tax=Streptomyces sp. NPDC060035 TaxID=3347044 RepID=UPI00369DF73B
MEPEVKLSGGRITPGVVRIGDTVRRPVTASSAFVADLLGLLEQYGFTGAPRYLGRDDAGRDSFGYLPGWVPATFQRWTDAQVAAAGALLGSLHEATRGSTLAAASAVVCHHDPGPNNTVFVDNRPSAFIDFDTAAPGDPLEDLGYMAWTWCISSRRDAPPAGEQATQVRILTDAYGLDAHGRSGLIDAMLDRQTRNARWWRERSAGPGPQLASADQILSRITWSEREHAFTVANRPALLSALR